METRILPEIQPYLSLLRRHFCLSLCPARAVFACLTSGATFSASTGALNMKTSLISLVRPVPLILDCSVLSLQSLYQSFSLTVADWLTPYFTTDWPVSSMKVGTMFVTDVLSWQGSCLHELILS